MYSSALNAKLHLICDANYNLFCPYIFHQISVQKDGPQYFAALEIKNVTVEDAGKYKVTAKNELGESNATITLNFDSKYLGGN